MILNPYQRFIVARAQHITALRTHHARDTYTRAQRTLALKAAMSIYADARADSPELAAYVRGILYVGANRA